MIIEINDRLYKELCTWAKANGMDDAAVAKYVCDAVREKLALDKYGDLNEKVSQPEPPKKRTTKKSEQPKPVEPINGPINKPINEPIPEIGTDEQISEQINEQISERINEKIKDEPPKRKSKVLVSK